MSNILLLGDSIRMFYENDVRNRLGEVHTVFSPQENCRFSSYMLNSLRFWLAEFPTPDIIHFNVGLWDTAILYHEDGCFTPLGEYKRNLEKIVRVLKSTGAELVFATTTPVSDEKEKQTGPLPPAHKNEDIRRYNANALEVLANEEVYINDLFSLVFPKKEKYLSDDMIHPNEDGVALLGKAVTNAISACLKPQTQSERASVVKISKCEKTMQ